ncbi:MAG: STAS domain-containing protein [Pseudomonadota bacterium]
MTSRAATNINGDTLSLSGVLDYESVLDVDMQVQQWLTDAAPSPCNLDLSQVTYSSSVGIAALLGWLRVAQQQQKTLHFQQMPANMAALAKVGGLDELLV